MAFLPEFRRYDGSRPIPARAATAVNNRTLAKCVGRYTAASGALQLKVNAQPEATAMGAGGGPGWDVISVGMGLAHEEAFDGMFFELMLFGRIVSDSERDLLLEYATRKWGS